MPEDTTAPLPSDEPAPAKPNEVEDLFKDPAPEPAAEPAAPEAEPKKSDDLEDLFKEDDKKGAHSAPVHNEALPQGLVDLFADPPAEVAKPAPTAVVTRQASPAKDVQQVAPKAMPEGMRLWSDNTGKYQVVAKLVSVGPKHVRLLKDTGKYTTVSFERLSRADLAFVFGQSPTSIASNQ
jgi:hypothetical protein